MPLLWLRIAVILYGLGLAYALLVLARHARSLANVIVHLMGLGMTFHLVSLVEASITFGRFLPANVHHSESLMAFMLMAVFMIVYGLYDTTSPGIFIFPLVFLLTFSSAIGQEPPQFNNPLLRSGWIITHVVLIFIGYAALAFSFAASLLYLWQERTLKSKRNLGLLSRLPALEVIDEIGYRLLLIGFPFMTLGLIAGSVVAQAKFGPTYFTDPKIVLSLLMWLVYVVLLYTRWSSGWRGRRAAMLASVAFVVAMGAWAANVFSQVHQFVQR